MGLFLPLSKYIPMYPSPTSTTTLDGSLIRCTIWAKYARTVTLYANHLARQYLKLNFPPLQDEEIIDFWTKNVATFLFCNSRPRYLEHKASFLAWAENDASNETSVK